MQSCSTFMDTKLDTVEMSALPKPIDRLNAIPVKI